MCVIDACVSSAKVASRRVHDVLLQSGLQSRDNAPKSCQHNGCVVTAHLNAGDECGYERQHVGRLDYFR